MKTSAMRNQELFNHMSREHGLTLLESEMHEIELIVARTLANDRVQEAARSKEGSVRSMPCSAALPWTEELPRAEGWWAWEAEGDVCPVQVWKDDDGDMMATYESQCECVEDMEGVGRWLGPFDSEKSALAAMPQNAELCGGDAPSASAYGSQSDFTKD